MLLFLSKSHQRILCNLAKRLFLLDHATYRELESDSVDILQKD